MALPLARFASLFLSGITTGVYVHGVISGPATKRVSGAAFTETSQEVNRDFARIMPVVGMTSLGANLLTLLFDRKGRSRPFLLTGAALALNIGATITTVQLNVPINDAIMTWERQNLPADWQQSRDRWLLGSKVRTALGLLEFACLILATQADTRHGE